MRRKAGSSAAATTACHIAAGPRQRTIWLRHREPHSQWPADHPRPLRPHRGDVRGRRCRPGGWLVRNGLTLDWPEYSKRKYDAAQRDAEQAGRVIWKGSYVEPWLYRVCIRANGTPAACSDDASAHP